MSHGLEYSPGPADQAVANAYDSFAEAYAAETESNLINGYYTRPAVLDLAGEVAGRRILDVGCGAGPLLAALRERGAVVTGVDSSTKMLELARQRLGDGADLHPADLSSPLPFPDGAFDDVIACLVLHLSGGLVGTAHRTAARSGARRPTHRGREPPHRQQVGRSRR
jgi:ubiquinone/menaquinone biosynthesis C-methylase UbiE